MMLSNAGLLRFGLVSKTAAHAASLILLASVCILVQPAGAIATTRTTLSISPRNSVVAGTAVILTATVSEANPVVQGLVVFCDASAANCEDAAILGTSQLTSSGNATLKLVLGVGSYSIAAVFHGTRTYPVGSMSAPQPLTVTGNASYLSTTEIAASGSPGNYTLTGTVKAFGRVAPTGIASFLDTSNSNFALGTAFLSPITLISTFTSSPGSPNFGGIQVKSMATGDLDGDGIADLAVANLGENTVSILLGKGDGTFQAQVKYSVGRSPYAIAVGDFNGDSKLDVVVTNRDDNTVSILLGNGDGTLQTQTIFPTGNSPLAVAVGDFNYDGIADLVVASATDNAISVLLGKGNGTFQSGAISPVGSLPEGIAVGDLNGDGFEDLAVANSSGNSLSVLLGNGDGSFQPQIVCAVGNAPFSVVTADLNGDGIADLVAANYNDDTLSVLLGNGDGTFQSQVAYAAGSGANILALGDFDTDGNTDIAVTNFTANTISVYRGNGDGTLQSQIVYAVGHGAAGMVVADFNGDGLPDLAAANYDDGTISALLAEHLESATATGVAVVGLGTHNVLAAYPGDTSQAASQSSTVALTGGTSTYTIVAPQRSFSVISGRSLNIRITVRPAGATYNSAITMSVSGLPSGATATFHPSTVIPGNAEASTVMTIQTSTQISSLPTRKSSPLPFAPITVAAGMCMVASKRKRLINLLPLLLACATLAGGTMALTGCGGGLGTNASVRPHMYVITVNGSSGSVHASTTVMLIAQ